MARKTIHCISHVDYTDASMVITLCGNVYHVNDTNVELLDESAFKERLPWFCCSDCEKELKEPRTRNLICHQCGGSLPEDVELEHPEEGLPQSDGHTFCSDYCRDTWLEEN